jgi:hypothetical protein
MTNETSAPQAIRTTPGKVLIVVTLLVVGGVGATWLGLAVRQARRAAQSSCIGCSTKQLSLAMHNYHDVHGCFPPAIVYSPAGEPLYSWRVVLLPYLDAAEVYNEFHLDEPWNSPHNRQFISQMPRSFLAATEPASDRFTNFVVVVGEQTAFPPIGTTHLSNFTDGPGNTILISEIANSSIIWSAPRDLEFDSMSLQLNAPDGGGISAAYWRQPAVSMADGATIRLPIDLTPAELLGLLTIAGGEPVGAGSLNGRPTQRNSFW